ncbi:trypsin-like peptidase domain-containing protein [Sorangium sp. So ce117]|uniref:trypsin-like peptidase domain-containing protein n=1 Tax=Sorangium sp. So ce117 TaxID=3133277 RepID=UPI003F5DE345
MDVQVAREFVELLEQRNRDAADLARLASVAVKIEPELLRALRLELLPGADVSAESDLWFSEIVEIRSPGAIVLFPEVAALLRTEIPGGVYRAWAVVRGVHRVLPQIVRLEEEITWLALSAGGHDQITEKLQQVLAAMLTDASRCQDLSAWALRALPRLPPAARKSPAFWMLLFVASATLRATSVPAITPPPAALRGISPSVLKGLGAAHLALEREADTLRLRPATAAGPGTIEVPATRPVVLEVTSTGAPISVALAPKGWTEVQVTGATVRLDTLDGRAYLVESPPAGEEAPAPDAEHTPEPNHELFQGCARVVVRGRRRIGGYLVAPDLVATCSYPFEEEREHITPEALRGTEESAWVVVSGVDRQARVVAMHREVDAALLRLDAPIDHVRPYDLTGVIKSEDWWRARGLSREGEPILLEGPLDATKIAHASGIFELPTVDAKRGLLTELASRPVRDGLAGAPVFVRGNVVGHIRHAEGSSLVAPGFTVTRIFVSDVDAVAALLRLVMAEPPPPAPTVQSPTDLAKVSRACARLFRPGEHWWTGTAYLVDTELAVTAAHVVADGVGPERRLSDVQLRFGAGMDFAIDARVLRVDPGTDCAVLRLAHPPDGVEPVSLARGVAPQDGLTLFGFASNRADGVSLFGTFIGNADRSGSPVLKLLQTDDFVHSLQSMTGAPVFLGDAVVGHLVAHGGERDLFACPAGAVRDLLGPQQSDFLPACASIVQGGVTGTAYLVTPTLAATSASLFHEAGERTTLAFRHGTRSAQLSELDPQRGVALLRLDEPAPVEVVDLAPGANTGERWMARWPSDGGLRLEGRVVGDVKPGASVFLLLECPFFSRALAGGLAGAPVEVNGRVVGHLTGYVGPAPDNPEFLHLHACFGGNVRDLLTPVEVRGPGETESFYIERGADQELLVTLSSLRACYVIAPRQSGKSSLVRHAARKLERRGIRCAVVDLSFLAEVEDTGAWLSALTSAILKDLRLPAARPRVFKLGVSLSRIWARNLVDTLRRSISGPTVLVLDEIDRIRFLSFKNEFLFALRSLVNGDEQTALIPCLVSFMWPEDLLPDDPTSLQVIQVGDFQFEDVAQMFEVMDIGSNWTEQLLEAVFAWTDGHPYLTRFLCSELQRESQHGAVDGAERVASLVRHKLLDAERAEVSTFSQIEHLVRTYENRRLLLEVYAGILRGAHAYWLPDREVYRTLLSIGLCKMEGDLVRVRNRIFATVFDQAWITQMLAEDHRPV